MSHHQQEDDFGPLGGVGSGNRQYGGKPRFTRNRSLRPSHDGQIDTALEGIKDETDGQPLNTQQLAHRLRIWLRDEYDVFLSEAEALTEVQKRQTIDPKQEGDTGQ